MIPETIENRSASRWCFLFGVLLASTAIALHSPGQISMDTSLELYEALIGRTVSNQPPFMSALMRWLGGGEVATAGLVMINSLATYFSLVSLTRTLANKYNKQESGGLPLWRWVVCALLVANPIIFIYVGIVWKDVLFGSAMLAAVALSILAVTSDESKTWLYAVGATITLAIVAHIRQQGVFMAPLLLPLPIIAVTMERLPHHHRCWRKGGVILATFIAAWIGVGLAVSSTIAKSGELSYSIGFRTIVEYDIAGIIAESRDSSSKLPITISSDQLAAVRAAYSSARVDSQILNPIVVGWFNHMTEGDKWKNWAILVRTEPMAYIRHRFLVYANLLNIMNFRGALPLHIGVEGNSEYLKAVGIPEQRGARALLIYRIASDFFGWPIYRHWFYFVSLLVGMLALPKLRMPIHLKRIGFFIAFAALIQYFAYFPTGIASDFRYLYGNILLVTAFWLLILCASGPRSIRPVRVS